MDNNLTPVTQITKTYNVSTRMLRYYEQVGLLKSFRTEGYSYRVYDDEACMRLKHIIILRKLRIPLKQIKTLFNDSDTLKAIEMFRQNISEIDTQINSLYTIRKILKRFVDDLSSKTGVSLRLDLLNDDNFLSGLISSSSQKDEKEKDIMDELQNADKHLKKLNVRIVYLPPSTVASYQFEGDDPEDKVHTVINNFVKKNNLTKIKPDLRHYGFNAPNPVDESGRHGYEMWVTIPDDFEVEQPLQKKHFAGGLYAAHMIEMGAFEEWNWLFEWVSKNEKYEADFKGGHEIMYGLLEEQLNYINRLNVPVGSGTNEGMQLDLLFPIKEKTVK